MSAQNWSPNTLIDEGALMEETQQRPEDRTRPLMDAGFIHVYSLAMINTTFIVLHASNYFPGSRNMTKYNLGIFDE